MKTPDGMLVSGEWRRQSDALPLELVNPVTEERWHSCPAAGRAEVEEACKTAAMAFGVGGWATPPPSRRAETLRRIAHRIRREGEDLAALETRTSGKPLREARVEVQAGADRFAAAAEALASLHGETISAEGAFGFTLHLPVGVIAAITPSNYPFLTACSIVAPALAVGNVIVLKPADTTPLTALALGQLVMDADAPDGILQILPGRDSEVAEALVGNPLVRMVVFAGERDQAARVMTAAAQDAKRTLLLTGGRGAAIVCSDADLERAAVGVAEDLFGNCGQRYTANRVLVSPEVYDDFVDVFVQRTATLRVGDPLDESTQVGPLISAARRKQVEQFLSTARQDGARFLCGGDRPRASGFFLSPTVLDHLPPTSELWRSPVRGPVACVSTYRGEWEAVECINNEMRGQAVTLWTRDIERALKLARGVRTRCVSVNGSRHREQTVSAFLRSGSWSAHDAAGLFVYTTVKDVYVAMGDTHA